MSVTGSSKVNLSNVENVTTKVEKKTTIEKFGDTKVGAFYKDSPVIAGVATGITALGVTGLAAKYEPLGKILFTRQAGGVIVGAAGALTLEDGIKDLKEGKQLKGTVKTVAGGVATLGGVELLTKIPAVSKPASIIFKNGYATGGAAVGVASGYMIKSAVDDIKSGEKVKGGLKAVAGGAGALSSVELVGRQFNKSLIIEPMAKVINTKGAQGVGAVVGATSSVALVVDGAKRLKENGSFLNDALGVAEVSGGAILAGGSTWLAGNVLGSEALKQVLPKTAKHIGGVALAGTSYTLGKAAVKDAAEKGKVSYINVAAGTGSALSALGALETFGVKNAFTGKSSQIIGGVGLGVASGILAKDAYSDAKKGKYGEAALKGFGSVVGAGGSLALVGVPGAREVGKTIVKSSWEHVILPVGKFAVEKPFLSIPLAIGGAYAIYKMTDKDENKKEEKVDKK